MQLDFCKIINKLENYKKIFLIDEKSKNFFLYCDFVKNIKKDLYNIKNLDNSCVYLLKVDNSIESLILISTFFYFKKKIILFPKSQLINKKNFINYKLRIKEIVVKKKIILKNISSNKLVEFDFDLLIMSSGSTGKSKLIKINLNRSLLNSISMGNLCRFNHKNIHYMIMPIYHVNSLFFSFMSSLIFKQKLIITKKLDPINFWKTINKYKIKTTSVSPSIIKLLNFYKKKEKFNSLKTIVCSSTFLPKSEYVQFYKNFKINITQGYGLSEATNFNTLMPISQNKIKLLNKFFKDESLITIGSAIPGNKIFIKNKKTGELIIKGKFLSNGYLGSNKKINQVFTGDIGYIKKYKKKEYIFLVSRKKEIIKYKDETVYPLDIENFISHSIKNKFNFFCFGFDSKFGTEIGCVIDKKNFKRNILTAMRKIKFNNTYQYFPNYIFVCNIRKFLTKTGKPQRKIISDLVSKNNNNLKKTYQLIQYKL